MGYILIRAYSWYSTTKHEKDRIEGSPLQYTENGKGIIMTDLKKIGESIINNLEQVIVGKSQSVELVVIGVLCQGHV